MPNFPTSEFTTNQAWGELFNSFHALCSGPPRILQPPLVAHPPRPSVLHESQYTRNHDRERDNVDWYQHPLARLHHVDVVSDDISIRLRRQWQRQYGGEPRPRRPMVLSVVLADFLRGTSEGDGVAGRHVVV